MVCHLTSTLYTLCNCITSHGGIPRVPMNYRGIIQLELRGSPGSSIGDIYQLKGHSQGIIMRWPIVRSSSHCTYCTEVEEATIFFTVFP